MCLFYDAQPYKKDMSVPFISRDISTSLIFIKQQPEFLIFILHYSPQIRTSTLLLLLMFIIT